MPPGTDECCNPSQPPSWVSERSSPRAAPPRKGELFRCIPQPRAQGTGFCSRDGRGEGPGGWDPAVGREGGRPFPGGPPGPVPHVGALSKGCSCSEWGWSAPFWRQGLGDPTRAEARGPDAGDSRSLSVSRAPFVTLPHLPGGLEFPPNVSDSDSRNPPWYPDNRPTCRGPPWSCAHLGRVGVRCSH